MKLILNSVNSVFLCSQVIFIQAILKMKEEAFWQMRSFAVQATASKNWYRLSGEKKKRKRKSTVCICVILSVQMLLSPSLIWVYRVCVFQDCSQLFWTWLQWQISQLMQHVVQVVQKCFVSWWNTYQASLWGTHNAESAIKGVQTHSVRRIHTLTRHVPIYSGWLQSHVS